LATSGMKPERIELEITESVLLANSGAAFNILHSLRDLGVRISMDDFGTGYSSLSYLRSFPVDNIKIDRSFICGLATPDGSDMIVRATIGLGRSLGMLTTAEGVETAEQLSQLRMEKCNEVQGYLFSPPVASRYIPELLERWDPTMGGPFCMPKLRVRSETTHPWPLSVLGGHPVAAVLGHRWLDWRVLGQQRAGKPPSFAIGAFLTAALGRIDQ
jgi:predicted signal transduction protein with EAL and GGDEF domain